MEGNEIEIEEIRNQLSAVLSDEEEKGLQLGKFDNNSSN
jgi:hypothetical protein